MADGIGLDFLTNVVNVQWEDEGSAVFIAGGSDFVLYAKTSKDDLDKQAIEKRKKENDGDAKIFEDLGPLDFGGPDVGSGVFASSYRKLGKATFVTAGSFSVEGGTGSVVMYSHDGREWTQAFYKQWPAWPGNDSGVAHMAWDNGDFHGLVYSDEYYFSGGDTLTPTNALTYERSLVSSDGTGWTEGESELRRDSQAVGGEPPPANLSPPTIFMPHVNPKSGLPDGKFGYYEKKNDEGMIVESYLVVPENFDPKWYLSKFVFFSSGEANDNYGNSITITKLKDGHTTVATKTTPITYVTCVAYASEILMAGGSSGTFLARIAASVDDGDNWEMVYEGPENYQVINTIIAARLSDLKKGEDATA
jgi:hypothetical protein